MNIDSKRRIVLLASLLSGTTPLASQTYAQTKLTILSRERVHERVTGYVEKGSLWLSESALEPITGFKLEAQGLCMGKICIPLPKDGSWEKDRSDQRFIDLSAFAAHIGQALIRDEQQEVWSLSQAPMVRGMGLESGIAPDFELPDLSGKLVHLSDFRGKKVLLLTWASW